MVAAGTFRDDLFYRINIFPIHAPALRERKDDIPPLAYHFLKQFSAELGKKITDISEGALSTLVNYSWPGNVRELENVMHRAAILTNDNVIRQAHLVNIVDPSRSQAPYPERQPLRRVPLARCFQPPRRGLIRFQSPGRQPLPLQVPPRNPGRAHRSRG